MPRALRLRLGYALATVALFAAEALIAVFVHDRIVRPFLGDSLVVILVYLALRSIAPLSVRAAATTAFLIACAVEFGQYLHLVDRLGLHDSRVARVLLGTFFDPRDFIAYAAGAFAALALERLRVAFSATHR